MQFLSSFLPTKGSLMLRSRNSGRSLELGDAGHEVSIRSSSTHWSNVPTPILYKEAIWGADPLEYWGGFNNLSFDENAGYNSALAADGSVKWGLTWANITDSPPDMSRAELEVGFPEVDWKFLQSVYGWSALQYQAWCRGYLNLNGSKDQTVAVFTDGILDFSIDGQRYFGGDFYSYRRAPLILNLAPGKHVVELRLIRDVRAMGGQGHPTINVAFEAALRHGLLTIDERSLLIPEVTNGKLGSTWASIDVQNNAAEWVDIISLNSSDVGSVSFLVHRHMVDTVD
jgi:hypothetical protein